jgi:hypothetical protein
MRRPGVLASSSASRLVVSIISRVIRTYPLRPKLNKEKTTCNYIFLGSEVRFFILSEIGPPNRKLPPINYYKLQVVCFEQTIYFRSQNLDAFKKILSVLLIKC